MTRQQWRRAWRWARDAHNGAVKPLGDGPPVHMPIGLAGHMLATRDRGESWGERYLPRDWPASQRKRMVFRPLMCGPAGRLP